MTKDLPILRPIGIIFIVGPFSDPMVERHFFAVCRSSRRKIIVYDPISFIAPTTVPTRCTGFSRNFLTTSGTTFNRQFEPDLKQEVKTRDGVSCSFRTDA